MANKGVTLLLSACILLFSSGCTMNRTGIAKQAEIHGLQSGDMVLLDVDVKLYELPLGGVAELQPGWTENAQRFLTTAIERELAIRGRPLSRLDVASLDPVGRQYLLLNQALSTALRQHGPGTLFQLRHKEGELDWSLGSGARRLDPSARYGLYVHVRDSYATGGRKAAVVAYALMGVSIPAGIQHCSVHLIDLDSGQLLWSNWSTSSFGDLREVAGANEVANRLLSDFPLAAPATASATGMAAQHWQPSATVCSGAIDQRACAEGRERRGVPESGRP